MKDKIRSPRLGKATFDIQNANSRPLHLTIRGRDRWALECLIAAGSKGCTPIETPGPRWSGYVHNLRQMGVQIETITEPHGGPFKGTHARYVIRSIVNRLDGNEAAA